MNINSKATIAALIDLNREVIKLEKEREKLLKEVKILKEKSSRLDKKKILHQNPQDLMIPIIDMSTKWEKSIQELKLAHKENKNLKYQYAEVQQQMIILTEKDHLYQSLKELSREKSDEKEEESSSTQQSIPIKFSDVSHPKILLYEYQTLMEEFFRPEPLPQSIVNSNEYKLFKAKCNIVKLVDIPQEIQTLLQALHHYSPHFDELTANEKHEIIPLIVQAKMICSSIVSEIRDISFSESLGKKNKIQSSILRRRSYEKYEVISLAISRFQFRAKFT